MKILSLALLMVLGSVAGCSGGGSSGNREPDEYTGCGSDENWRTFEDQEKTATVSDQSGPFVTSPSAGASVPSSTKVKLTWQQDPNDPGQPDGDVPYMGPGCNQCCPQFNTGSLSTLHLPPISGDVYDLQFSIGATEVWRVVTTLQEWGPSDALWATWTGKTVSLKMWRMAVLTNDVKSGPFVATQPFTFSVTN
jgi:hypothetical protein